MEMTLTTFLIGEKFKTIKGNPDSVFNYEVGKLYLNGQFYCEVASAGEDLFTINLSVLGEQHNFQVYFKNLINISSHECTRPLPEVGG